MFSSSLSFNFLNKKPEAEPVPFDTSARLFLNAAAVNDVAMMKQALANIPEGDINTPRLIDRKTILSKACEDNIFSAMYMLLARPDIDVNKGDHMGRTPLSTACSGGHNEIVQYLLRDARVDINHAGVYLGGSPLGQAIANKNKRTVRLLMASGKFLWLGQRDETMGDSFFMAREYREGHVLRLLREYADNRQETARKLKLTTVWRLIDAVLLFALVVMLCDGYIRIPDKASAERKYVRFFAIARRLPIELQTLLCHRAFGSMKGSISSSQASDGFMITAQAYKIMKGK